MEWFEVVFKNVLVKKRCDEKAPSWCLLEKGRKVMVLPKRETDAKGRLDHHWKTLDLDIVQSMTLSPIVAPSQNILRNGAGQVQCN